MGFDSLVKTLDSNDLIISEKETPHKGKYLHFKRAYPYEYFNSVDDYKKTG